VRRIAIALLGLAATLGVAQVAAAQSGDPAPASRVLDVVEVSGLLDAPVVDFVERRLDAAVADGAEAVVLQLNSTGAVVPAERVARLAETIADSPVLVGIWVGPSGSRGYGEAGQLLGAAPVTGMAPGSRIGNFGDPLPVEGITLDFGTAAAELADGTLGLEQAELRGAVRNDAVSGTPTLGDFVVALDGVTYRGTTLDTAVTVETADGPRQQLAPDLTPRSFKLELLPRLFHTVASPPVTYLLLAIGLSLLVFEFFTAGVGVAGVVGAVSIILGCYGAAALPTRGWAFALLVLSTLAFAIDVQTGVPRVWTGIGVAMFTVASLTLYDGLRISWITLLVGIAGILLTYVVGMPSMVRTRFATPTVGREWMVGQAAEAVTDVDPDGIVRLREAQWRARTNRATPIRAGERALVVAIDGVTLEVEPESGGARDYRERRGRDRSDAPVTPTTPVSPAE
jgi:membrane-bound serine protease (ClpP class)